MAYHSVGGLLGGGLERVHVYFSKPHFYLEAYTPDERITPLGEVVESQGYYRRVGWEAPHRMWVQSQSFGNWLGYAKDSDEHRELALYVWTKIGEHFNGLPMDRWEEQEKNGTVLPKDFLLELDIHITFSVPPKKCDDCSEVLIDGTCPSCK